MKIQLSSFKKILFWVLPIPLLYLFSRTFLKELGGMDTLLSTIGKFAWYSLGLSALAISGQYFCSVGRFFVLYPRSRDPFYPAIFRATAVGHALNAVAPGRVGELARLYALSNASKRPGRSVSLGLSLVLVEKLCDGGGLLLFFLIFRGYSIGSFDWKSRLPSMTTILIVVSVLVIGGGLALYYFREKIFAMAKHVRQALREIANVKTFAVALSLGILGWCGEALSVKWLASQQGVQLAWSHAAMTVLFINGAIAVPISVANVGAMEAAIALGTSLSGASAVEGLAIGLTHHAIQVALTLAYFGVAEFIYVRTRGKYGKGSESFRDLLKGEIEERDSWKQDEHREEGPGVKLALQAGCDQTDRGNALVADYPSAALIEGLSQEGFVVHYAARAKDEAFAFSKIAHSIECVKWEEMGVDSPLSLAVVGIKLRHKELSLKPWQKLLKNLQTNAQLIIVFHLADGEAVPRLSSFIQDLTDLPEANLLRSENPAPDEWVFVIRKADGAAAG